MSDSPDYFDQGFALYKAEPELLLIEVWRHAAALDAPTADRFDVVIGYCTARRQHDEYEKDQTS